MKIAQEFVSQRLVHAPRGKPYGDKLTVCREWAACRSVLLPHAIQLLSTARRCSSPLELARIQPKMPHRISRASNTSISNDGSSGARRPPNPPKDAHSIQSAPQNPTIGVAAKRRSMHWNPAATIDNDVMGMQTEEGQKNKGVRPSGVEPESAEWKSAMLTVTPWPLR
ncbi:hypothetical protein VFPFJ_10792 [Purpureocillium lilacinum]|uniref:Uncharacterized protein n=1 Tax=Purpureocillium lilacinum TaxID=33203 RepID=A0A179GDD2_PURLI|nr:hypothetical protein VFPFJ_10792 [Purpureocillium lilacinum]OAQ75802.1 hypothetical protein VFPFJ_10792 [Purpureocillium lilacinum]OAQ80544.1 hypothetical protein VFPBJ_06129 [Purpureocillium lilacinum]